MVDNRNDRDVHGHSSLSSAPEDKKTNWLPLLLGALLLLGLLFLLLRGCDDEEPVVTPTDTATPVETTAAAPVGAAAVAPVAYSRETFDRTLTGTDPLPVTYGLDRVTFASGSSELNSEAQSELSGLAQSLSGRQTARISLRGFADPAGDAAANQKLSEERVAAVRKALVDGGVAESQIETAAAGETGMAATQENRRVEITLLSR